MPPGSSAARTPGSVVVSPLGDDAPVVLLDEHRQPTGRLPKSQVHHAETPLHLTLTYRNGELVAYRDGMQIARSTDLWGSLAAWRSGPLTVGADASGVDLLPGKDGQLYVLEINAVPGWRALAPVTGVDVAAEIVKYLA